MNKEVPSTLTYCEDFESDFDGLMPDHTDVSSLKFDGYFHYPISDE